MKKNKLKIKKLPLAFLMGMCVCDYANAQNVTLPEVVVTSDREPYYAGTTSAATRTETPVEQIPQSIIVINKNIIEDQGSKTVSEVLRNVSNVNYIDQRDSNIYSFKIRGFNSGFVVDGVAMPGYFQNLESMANIDSLAIIKGPAGGLFGSQGIGSSASLGGTVVVNTLEANQTTSKQVGLNVGTYNQKGTSFDINQPLNSVLATRLSGEISDAGSEVNQVFFKKTALFSSFSLTPNQDTKVVLRLRYVDNSTMDYSGLPRNSTGSGVAATGLARSTFVSADGQPETTNNSRGVNLQINHKLNEIWKFNLTVAHNEVTLDENGVFQAGYMLGSIGTGSSQALAGMQLWEKFKSDTISPSLIAKFDLANSKHTVNLGVDLEKSTDDGYMAFASGPDFFTPFNLANPSRPQWGSVTRPVDGSPDWQNNKATSTITYVQDQIDIDKLHFLAGIRHSNFKVDNVWQSFGVDSHTKNTHNSYRYGAAYDISSGFSLFSGYSDGAKVPTNLIFLTPPKVEESAQKEIGFKVKDLNGVTATLAFFELKRKNAAIQDPIHPAFVSQIGEQESKGVDLDINWKVNYSWQWIAAYTNQSAKVTSDVSHPNLVGAKLFNVPQESLRLATRYDVNSGDLVGLGMGMGLTYHSKLAGDNENNYFTDAATVWDAQLSYKYKNARYGFYINNLFNKQYFIPSAYFLGGQVTPALPRTLMASAQFSF